MRAQAGLRALCAQRRRDRPARARGQGAVGRLRSRRRLSRARRDRAEIGRRLAAISPIRAIAGVRQVSGSVYKKPFTIAGPAAGWVGETDARPQTTTPTLAELQFPTMEIYAMPAATQTLLDDAAVDIEHGSLTRWRRLRRTGRRRLRHRRRRQQAERLSRLYQRRRFGWSWGNLGYVATGVDGAFRRRRSLRCAGRSVYALKAGYRQNAHWVMNRKTQAAIRKFKDADGNYLWQPPAAAGGRRC